MAEAARRKEKEQGAMHTKMKAQDNPRNQRNEARQARSRPQQRVTDANKKKEAKRAVSEDATTKARLKLEKLRERLQMEERKVAELESKSLKRKHSLDGALTASSPSQTKKDDTSQITSKSKSTPPPEPNSEAVATVIPSGIASKQKLEHTTTDARDLKHSPPQSMSPADNDVLSDASSDDSSTLAAESIGDLGIDLQSSDFDTSDSQSIISSRDTEDLTSSSGSSDSDGGSSDDDDDDGGPMESTAKQEVPPLDHQPQAAESKGLCSHYARTGRCKFGASCRYRHERPVREKRATKSIVQRLGGRRNERISLYQRVSCAFFQS